VSLGSCDLSLRSGANAVQFGSVVSGEPLGDLGPGHLERPGVLDTQIRSRGRRHDATGLAGMLAEIDGERLGLATYRVERDEVEVVTMDALIEGRGIGAALLEAVAEFAGTGGCRRLWLVTTNDNLDALRFYQRRGLSLVAVHRGAVDQARVIKPQIPEVGALGIAVHDEIELELDLPSG
jgi:GNAT superfamily N-acetyltransferase